jgi:GT2 family glycosyltransferase
LKNRRAASDFSIQHEAAYVPSGRITVVIPTHERKRQLFALLGSIRDHYTPEIDSIVVVDDSREPSDLTSAFPSLSLRHIVLPDRVFISKAKDVGWRCAETEFVFFIDDDNVVDADTIPTALNTITQSEEIAAVMPSVLYKSKPDLVWVYATPFSRRPPGFDLVGRNLPRNPKLEGKYYTTDALPNASIIRRNALVEVGGFNERLMINSSMDLAVRLKKRGWKVLAYSGCFIYHDVEPPGRLGWWATHGAADPQRVRYEISDWFLIMRLIRGSQSLLTVRSAFQSLRFVLPNAFAYMIRGRARRQLISSIAKGYAEGITTSRRPLKSIVSFESATR